MRVSSKRGEKGRGTAHRGNSMRAASVKGGDGVEEPQAREQEGLGCDYLISPKREKR